MCGIVVGVALGELNKTDEIIRQKLLRYFTTELLFETEVRGKDATGAAVLFKDGNFTGLKRGEKVSEFLSKYGEHSGHYGEFLKSWKVNAQPAKIYLGHCRAGTVGEKEDNVNNHPIQIGNLVGIHNGKIANHNIIFNKLGCDRTGKVDSESIFRLFDYYTNRGAEPFTIDMLQNIVNRLDGQFTVTLFNANNMGQIPFFRDARPLEFILIRPYSILLAVSQLDLWKKVLARYQRTVSYNYDMLGIEMPLLNDKSEIVIEGLPDDSAIIFDITKNITPTTVIGDISERKKMSRNEKMWKGETIICSSCAGYIGGRRSDIRNTTVNKNKVNSENKKRRVFDNITKKYVIEDGDKVLKDGESTVLQVVDKYEKPTKSIAIVDYSNYDKKNDTKEVIQIDMDTKSRVEAQCKANNVYKNLPFQEHGYNNIVDMMCDLEIKHIANIKALSPVVLANKTYKQAWKKGYIAKSLEDGISNSNEDTDTISGLNKDLITLLVKLCNTRTYNNHSIFYTNELKSDLNRVIVEMSSEGVDIDRLAKETNLQGNPHCTNDMINTMVIIRKVMTDAIKEKKEGQIQAGNEETTH